MSNMPIFYDNVRKPVPECETILDFADARDDGRGSGDNQHSKNRCKSFTPGYSHHQRHTNTVFCRLDATQSTATTKLRKHKATKQKPYGARESEIPLMHTKIM